MPVANSGAVIAGSNCASAYYGSDIGSWQIGCIQPGHLSANEALVSDRERAQGISYASRHPARAVLVAAVRLLRVWSLFAPTDQAVGNITLLWIGTGLYYCLLAAAGYALWVRWRRGLPIMILISPAIVASIASILGDGPERLRYEAELPLLALAAWTGVTRSTGSSTPRDECFAAQPHGRARRFGHGNGGTMVCRRGKQLIRRTALLGALAATMLAGLVTAAGAAARFGSALPSRAYVVGTFADGHLEWDVNGVQVARRWVRGRLDHTRLPLEIGSFLGGAVWAGAIDEVAIYRRSLSASTIAAHYRLGTDLRPANPNAYRDLITHTPGLVSYWALDDSGRVAVDSYGHNNGVYTLGVTEGHPGLIAGERGAAAMFNGRSGSVRVTQSRSLNFERGFTLEAWVTTAVTGDKAIVARAGSYFLKTDALGHWRFGVYMGGRIFSIYSVVGTHGPATNANQKSERRPGQGVPGSVWPLIIAAIVAVVLVARRGYGVRSSGPGKQPTQPHARKFPLVDSLRALAALGVLMTHASWFSGLNYRASPGRFTQRLDVGVALFFLISGLLLYRPFVLANLKRSSAPASGPYAWRRFLRIMPAYWFCPNRDGPHGWHGEIRPGGLHG